MIDKDESDKGLGFDAGIDSVLIPVRDGLVRLAKLPGMSRIFFYLGKFIGIFLILALVLSLTALSIELIIRIVGLLL